MVLLLTPGDAGNTVVARRARLRDRLAARWHAGSLDRTLASPSRPRRIRP
jgi:hypothetical protein